MSCSTWHKSPPNWTSRCKKWRKANLEKLFSRLERGKIGGRGIIVRCPPSHSRRNCATEGLHEGMATGGDAFRRRRVHAVFEQQEFLVEVIEGAAVALAVGLERGVHLRRRGGVMQQASFVAAVGKRARNANCADGIQPVGILHNLAFERPHGGCHLRAFERKPGDNLTHVFADGRIHPQSAAATLRRGRGYGSPESPLRAGAAPSSAGRGASPVSFQSSRSCSSAASSMVETVAATRRATAPARSDARGECATNRGRKHRAPACFGRIRQFDAAGLLGSCVCFTHKSLIK